MGLGVQGLIGETIDSINTVNGQEESDMERRRYLDPRILDDCNEVDEEFNGIDDDCDDEGSCPQCGGSGGGDHPGIRCHMCNGTGIEK